MVVELMLEDVRPQICRHEDPTVLLRKSLLDGSYIQPLAVVCLQTLRLPCHLPASTSSGQLKVSHCCPGKLRGPLSYVVSAVVKKSFFWFAGILSCL